MSNANDYLQYICNPGNWYNNYTMFTNDTIRPVAAHPYINSFYSITLKNKQFNIAAFYNLILNSLLLKNLLVMLIYHKSDTSTYYIGITNDSDYNMSDYDLHNQIEANNSILEYLFNSNDNDISYIHLEAYEINELLNTISMSSFNGLLSGTLFSLVNSTSKNALTNINYLSDLDYYEVSLLKPLNNNEIKGLLSSTCYLYDSISSLATETRSILHSQNSSCSSSSSISGNMSNSNSENKNNDRREILIDISQDDEADFWSNPSRPFTAKQLYPVNTSTNQQKDAAITRSRGLSHSCVTVCSTQASDTRSKNNSNTCITSCSKSQTTFCLNAKNVINFLHSYPYQQFNSSYQYQLYLVNNVFFSNNPVAIPVINGALKAMLTGDCLYAPCRLEKTSNCSTIANTVLTFVSPYIYNNNPNDLLMCRSAFSSYCTSTKTYSGNLLTGRQLINLFDLFYI